MKIDEPKTPFVTDEEFKWYCDEDPEYQAAFGNNLQNVDMRSDEACGGDFGMDEENQEKFGDFKDKLFNLKLSD